METISLKALSIQRLQGNRQGNSKETLSFHKETTRETTAGNGGAPVSSQDDEVMPPPTRRGVYRLEDYGTGGESKRTTCYSCHGSDFWRSAATEEHHQICRTCHPPAKPELEWIP